MLVFSYVPLFHFFSQVRFILYLHVPEINHVDRDCRRNYRALWRLVPRNQILGAVGRLRSEIYLDSYDFFRITNVI